MTIKLCLIAMLFSSSVLSSNIVISQGNEPTRFVAGAKGQNDIVVQAVKNSQNISFNHFDNFELYGKPLSIYNGSILPDGSASADSSKTIVITANTINLSEEIKIIGAPADLLIIAPYNISCSQCRFVNAGRVTIATASYSELTTIGNLTTSTSGAITINDLIAPGIQSVEIIAEKINLAGTINTNFRADPHPSNGMLISESGAKVIGGGGVNIYPGKFTIDYKTLTIRSASATSAHTISADILSASIAVTSPNNITLPAGNDLNTANDALSSSVRNGEFYAPLEGIFLSTLQNESASITINGDLISDNKVYLKSHNNITFSASNRSITKYVELIAKNTIITDALFQTTDLTSSAASYINTGNITANTVLINVDNNIFNSYGGVIKAKKITLIAKNGYVTNGSRGERINYSPSDISTIFNPTPDTLAWGISNITGAIPTSGSIASDLSANLLANEIYIDTKKFENINPYLLNRASETAWDEGITVNNHTANHVSIQAENTLKIKATNYALNSSAILGLNQAGSFHISTPLLSNARYHLTGNTFVSNQLVYSPDSSIKESVLETGTVTKVTGYSPPGRIYSFGVFKFSALSGSLVNAIYSNEFSYTEFFQDSYFAQTNIKSYGLELSENVTAVKVNDIRKCLIHNKCQQEELVTLAEAETLLSFNDNVYGIDASLPTQSDLEVVNINGNDTAETTAINNYHQQFFYDYRTEAILNDRTVKVGNHGYVYDYNIDGDTLTTYYKKCWSKIIAESEGGEFYGYYYDDRCTKLTDYKAISDLMTLVIVANEFGSTGYSYAQIEAAAAEYITTLPLNTQKAPPKASYTNNLTSVSLSGENIAIAYEQHAQWTLLRGSDHSYTDIVTEVPLSILTPYIP